MSDLIKALNAFNTVVSNKGTIKEKMVCLSSLDKEMKKAIELTNQLVKR